MFSTGWFPVASSEVVEAIVKVRLEVEGSGQEGREVNGMLDVEGAVGVDVGSVG